jgi:hypothetical protein
VLDIQAEIEYLGTTQMFFRSRIPVLIIILGCEYYLSCSRTCSNDFKLVSFEYQVHYLLSIDNYTGILIRVSVFLAKLTVSALKPATLLSTKCEHPDLKPIRPVAQSSQITIMFDFTIDFYHTIVWFR